MKKELFTEFRTIWPIVIHERTRLLSNTISQVSFGGDCPCLSSIFSRQSKVHRTDTVEKETKNTDIVVLFAVFTRIFLH